MKSFVTALSMVVISGCSQRPVASASQKENIARSAIKLGEGWDHLKNMPSNSDDCVKFEPHIQGVSEITSFFEKIDDVSTLKTKTGFAAEGEFTYGLVSGSAKASLVSESESSQRSLSFYAYRKVTSKIERAMNATPSATYEPVKCGAKYVSALARGAEINILMKVTFSSTKAMSKFDAEARGSYSSIGSVKASISSMSEEMKSGGSITIKKVSTGENLSTLSNIFKGQDFVTCSISDFGHCENIIADLVNYMEGDFNQAAAISNDVISYELSDVPNQNGSLPQELIEKRDHLARSISTFSKDASRAEEMAQSKYLSREERDGFAGVRDLILENANQARIALKKCYTTPESCSTDISASNYDKDSLKVREIVLEEKFKEETNGVHDCRIKLQNILQGKCEELLKAHEVNAVKSHVSFYGNIVSIESDERWRGGKRSCEARTRQQAVCQLTIEI